MKTISIERDDGKVSIMRTNDNADVAQEVAKWQGSFATAKAVRYAEVPESAIPKDRSNRSNWKFSDIAHGASVRPVQTK